MRLISAGSLVRAQPGPASASSAAESEGCHAAGNRRRAMRDILSRRSKTTAWQASHQFRFERSGKRRLPRRREPKAGLCLNHFRRAPRLRLGRPANGDFLLRLHSRKRGPRDSTLHRHHRKPRYPPQRTQSRCLQIYGQTPTLED